MERSGYDSKGDCKISGKLSDFQNSYNNSRRVSNPTRVIFIKRQSTHTLANIRTFVKFVVPYTHLGKIIH